MDDFPAMSREAAEGSIAMVRRCDLFIGLYARRYGTTTPNGRSIIEHEYEEARTRKLPRLCFLLRESAEWPEEFTEVGPSSTALNDLKQRIRAEVIVDEFSSLEELEAEAISAVDEYLQKEARHRKYRIASFLCGLMLLTAAALTMNPTIASKPTTQQIALGGSWTMSRDHRLVVFTGKNSAIWPLDREFNQKIELPVELYGVTISPLADIVAGYTKEGNVYIYRHDRGFSSSGRPFLSQLNLEGFNHEWGVFSPDGKWICICSTDGACSVSETRISHEQGLRPPLNVNITHNGVYAISPDILFSRTGQWIGIVDDEGSVYVAQPNRVTARIGSVFRSVDDPGGDALRPRLWFSDDEKWVASSDRSGSLAVWPTGERPANESTPDGVPRLSWAARGAFTRDSRSLIIRAPYGGFSIRDLKSPLETRSPEIVPFRDTGSEISGKVLWLSQDGRWAAGVTPDQSLHVWNLHERKTPIRAIEKDWPMQVDFSPNGEWLAAIVDSGSLYIWRPDLSSAVSKPALTYGGHRSTFFEWCKDSQHFFTYGEQNVFYGEAGRDNPEPVFHDLKDITDIAVTPDGVKLLVLTLVERIEPSRGGGIRSAPTIHLTLRLSLITRKLYLWGVPVKTLLWPQLADKAE